MPDFDANAYVAEIFGEVELISQPPRIPTGPAASLPRFQAQMQADLRFAASPELKAIKAGEIVARVIDLDVPGLSVSELPPVAWDWDLRWRRDGRLLLRDPSFRSWHFFIVSFTRTEAPKTTADLTIPSPAVKQEAPAAPLTLERLRKLTPEQTKQRHERARNYRKQAIAEIRATGKVPGTSDYSQDKFVREVRTRCGLLPSEEVRGFSRTRLWNLFNSLKN
jgi:hypothetical protein